MASGYTSVDFLRISTQKIYFCGDLKYCSTLLCTSNSLFCGGECFAYFSVLLSASWPDVNWVFRRQFGAFMITQWLNCYPVWKFMSLCCLMFVSIFVPPPFTCILFLIFYISSFSFFLLSEAFLITVNIQRFFFLWLLVILTNASKYIYFQYSLTTKILFSFSCF